MAPGQPGAPRQAAGALRLFLSVPLPPMTLSEHFLPLLLPLHPLLLLLLLLLFLLHPLHLPLLGRKDLLKLFMTTMVAMET